MTLAPKGRRVAMGVVMKVLAVCATLALLVPSVSAGDKHKDKDKSKGHGGEVVVTFSVSEREAAQTYFVEKHGRGHCPPGLAKKENGCLPPGQAKKRYVVGYPLSKKIVPAPPPPELLVRVGPPPAGYSYVVIDGDLVKLATGTLMVVDAIQGLVH